MTTLSIRIDSELKKSAEDTLEKIGLTPSQAVRLLFKQIVLAVTCANSSKISLNV